MDGTLADRNVDLGPLDVARETGEDSGALVDSNEDPGRSM
jgi:hypothetical protein